MNGFSPPARVSLDCGVLESTVSVTTQRVSLLKIPAKSETVEFDSKRFIMVLPPRIEEAKK